MSDIDVYKEWLGIPEADRPPDHYTLLRLVMFEDDPDKIQNNYRKLNNHIRKFATGQYQQESQDLLNELAKAMLCLTDPDSKSQYDVSLGREPQQIAADDSKVTTLEYLVNEGTLERHQVSEIEHFADARGLTHRDAVIQMKLAEPEQAAKALAAELQMTFIDLAAMLPEDDVLDRLPRSVVKRHTCVPLYEDGGRLLVACAQQPSLELEDEVRMRYGIPIRGVLAVPRQVNQAIAKYYAPGSRTETAPIGGPAAGDGNMDKGKATKKEKKKPTRDPAVPLTDEERAARRNISLIILCWSVIVPMVGMNTLTELGIGSQAAITCVTAAVTFGLLKLTYWK